jgi:transcriptional regulator with XRE-family HTH domain
MHACGFGPSELSRRSGVSRAHIDRIVKCSVDPSLDTLRDLARSLGVHNSHLIGRMYSDYRRPLNRSEANPKYVGYDSAFIADVTYPDNSIVATNQVFEKVWEIQNVGDRAWDGFIVRSVDDPNVPARLKPLDPPVELGHVEPGETVRIAVRLKAPGLAGTVVSRWKMFDEDGELVFPEKDGIYCVVVVEDL